MANISEKIAGLLNTAPISYDPEDDINEETTARVVSGAIDEDSDEEIIGKFRKQNVELLEDIDRRYVGKRAARKTLDNEWSNDENNLLGSDSDDSTVREAEEESSGITDIDSATKDVDDSEENSISSLDKDEDIQTSFTHIEEPDLSNQIQKGQCVRQQLSMWENLLEMRIQLQKCLIAGNKLPQQSLFGEIKSSHNITFNDTRKSLTTLLDKLLYLQLLVLRRYPETKSLLSSSTQISGDKINNDEEIPSDTEDEQQSDSDEELPRKKQKLNYVSELQKRHESYKKYRDSIIQKWNDKTRIANNKSGNSLHSVVKHIDHVLSDQDKLIKRTQLSRIDYGIKETKPQEHTDNSTDEIYSTEIFDDTDFYHQLLRELIEYKSADLTDPVQLGRQWIQLQNLRSKMKRKIDTRATKGRKIRYVVHSKLVNFMAPVEDITWQSDAKTELYNSLFGKGQPVNNIGNANV